MDSRSPRVRTAWRAIALLFAVSVVTIRLGMAGCGPRFYGPTKAGGGFNATRQVAREPEVPPAAKSTTKTATKTATPAAKPAANAGGDPRPSYPAYFPPTKAGGGFYAPPPAAAAQQQAPRQATEPR